MVPLSIPVDQIKTEAERRSWIEPQVLAVLTLAIDENWDAIPNGFFNSLEALLHPTFDPWYQLAQLRRVGPADWQAFKMRLYRNIRQAVDLYNGAPAEEDPFMALTDDEQRELLTKVRAIFDDAHDTRLQLRGPNDAGWKQLGTNAKGQNLSFIDALGRVKDKLFGTNNAVS